MKKAGTLKKNKKSAFLRFTKFIVIFAVILSFITILFNNVVIIAGGSQFIPASPTGKTSTGINVENEYIVYTSEVGSCWMFDWGDGNYSDWIKVGTSHNFISQSHSWSSYGEYQVKVKQKSIYMVESAWSSPLTVKVTPPADADGDGYSNDMERSYGTDPNNPNDHPLDTDKDGIPDDSSPDGRYTGDTDDDNDGVSDIIEEKIGSNPKNFGDITIIVFDGTIYCLADTNGDGNSDVLYNFNTGLKTSVSTKGDTVYLDTNGDGKWEYTYRNGMLYKQPFEIPLLYIILAIVLIILILIFVLFKKGILFLYQEEYIIEKEDSNKL